MNPSSLRYLKHVRRRKQITKYVSYHSSPSNLSSTIFNYLSIPSSEAEAIRDHFRNTLMVYTASEKEGTEKVRTVISTLGKSTIHYVKEAKLRCTYFPRACSIPGASQLYIMSLITVNIPASVIMQDEKYLTATEFTHYACSWCC